MGPAGDHGASSDAGCLTCSFPGRLCRQSQDGVRGCSSSEVAGGRRVAGGQGGCSLAVSPDSRLSTPGRPGQGALCPHCSLGSACPTPSPLPGLSPPNLLHTHFFPFGHLLGGPQVTPSCPKYLSPNDKDLNGFFRGIKTSLGTQGSSGSWEKCHLQIHRGLNQGHSTGTTDR